MRMRELAIKDIKYEAYFICIIKVGRAFQPVLKIGKSGLESPPYL